MIANGVNNVGFQAKITSQNIKTVLSVKKSNNAKSQAQIDQATKKTIKRAQIPFELMRKKMYRKNGSIMGLGISSGIAFNQKA